MFVLIDSGAGGAGKANFATSASLTRDASTATATVTRGSASARPTGVASSAIKVRSSAVYVTRTPALMTLRMYLMRFNKCHDGDLTCSNRSGIYHSRNESRITRGKKKRKNTVGWVSEGTSFFSIPIIISFFFCVCYFLEDSLFFLDISLRVCGTFPFNVESTCLAPLNSLIP